MNALIAPISVVNMLNASIQMVVIPVNVGWDTMAILTATNAMVT